MKIYGLGVGSQIIQLNRNNLKGTILTSEGKINLGRQKRLLNVFTIVSFPNDACTITSGNTNTTGKVRCGVEISYDDVG